MSAWGMKTPCGNCPFRRTGGIRVHPGRAKEIARMMLSDQGGTFPCHKSVDYDKERDEQEDGHRMPKKTDIHCGGALIFAVKNDNHTQMMRIAGRLGMFNPDELDLTADVFDTQKEMIKANAR